MMVCVRKRIHTEQNTCFSVAYFPSFKLLVINIWICNRLLDTCKFSTICSIENRPQLLELAERAEIDPVNDKIGELLCLI